MKTGKKVLLTLLSATCLTAGAFGLVACSDDTADTRDQQIVAAYHLYAEAAGDSAMTYEQWLDTIKGEKGDTGATGATGPKGDKGDQGDPGEDGEDGKDGATWLFGAEDPTQSNGKTGDFYLNTTTYEIFVKTNISTWTSKGNIKGSSGTGTPGTPGEPGAPGEPGKDGEDGKDGVGISDIQLVGNVLRIFFTDEIDEDGNDYLDFTLPEELFHVHNYGADYVVLMESTEEAEGIAYKVCKDDGHVELFTLPKSGTVTNPKTIANAGQEIGIDATVFKKDDYVYYKYTAKQDGYVHIKVPTAKIEYDYEDKEPTYTDSVNFHVYRDAAFENKTYDYTDRAGTNLSEKAYFEKGETVYIRIMCGAPIDGKYKFTVAEYDTESNYAHTVNVYDEGEDPYSDDDNTPIKGATVKLYTKSGSDYKEVENATATTDENGKATFNVPIGKYYFSVETNTDSEYAPSEISTKTAEWFEIDLRFNAERALEKYVTHTVTVQYEEDGETKKAENVTVKLGSSSYGINEATTKGQGTTDANGSVTIKALPNSSYYIYLENLPTGYAYAGGVRVYKSDAATPTTITLTVAPTEITLTGSETTQAVVTDTTYVFKIEAGKTYTLAFGDGEGNLCAVKIGGYSLVGDSGKGGQYLRYCEYTLNDNSCVTSVTVDNNTFKEEQITFKVSADTTVTITVEGEGEEVLTLTDDAEFNLEAGKTYVISLPYSGAKYNFTVEGAYFITFTVGSLEAVKDGEFTSWGSMNPVHETDGNGKAVSFAFNGSKNSEIRFTVSADVSCQVTLS